MDNIITRVIPLPSTINALTVRDNEGDYNIYINSSLSRRGAENAYEHELRHIRNKDFDSELDIHFLERRANRKRPER